MKTAILRNEEKPQRSRNLRGNKTPTIFAGYNVDSIDEINTFLAAQTGMVDFIKKTPPHIKTVFGKEIELFLSLFTDPEESTQTLNIYISHKLGADIALKKEMELFDSWFKPYYTLFKGRINISEVSA